MIQLALIRRSRLPAAIRSLAILLLLPMLPGCTDLNQVKELAKEADTAKPALIPIAADFKGSCDRANSYAGFPPPPAAFLPCKNAADLEKLGKNILKEQSLLLDYFDALGTLADTDATGFEKAAPSLDTTFDSNALSATQLEMAKDAGTIAADITKLVTLRYREKKIAQLLWEAEPAVQRLTRGLANQVAPGSDLPAITSYLGLLSNEDIALKTYYEIPLTRDSSSPSALLLLNQYQKALAEQARRKDAAKSYRKLMLALGEAHTKLLHDSERNGFDKAAAKKLVQDLAGPAQEISEAIDSLRKDAM